MIREILLMVLVALASLCTVSMAQEDTAGYWVDKASELLKESSNVSLNQNDSKVAMLNAFEAYSKALEIDPQMAEAWANKGKVLYMLERPDEAVDSYKRYLEMYPENYTIRSLMIEALTVSGRNEEALNQTYMISEVDPSSQGWCNRGMILIELGEFKDALDSFNRSLEIDPQSAQALYWKAGVLAEMGRAEKALEFYDEATRIDPQFAEAWRDKGYILKNLGRGDEAREAFSNVAEIYDGAIKLNPNDIDAWIEKGSALAYINESEEANRCYDKAIELSPQYLPAWNSKGVTLYSLGKYEEAVQCFDKVIQLNPKYARAWYYKGLALNELGLNAEAKNAFAQAKDLGFRVTGQE